MLKKENMKKMKYIFLSFVLLEAVKWSPAQEFKVAADNTKEAKLTLLDFNGELPIEGYSGNEIIVTSTSGRLETPERAKGLKPIYGGGTDNTGIGLYMEKNGNSVTLRCLVPFTQQSSYKLRVPENIALKIERDCARSGETTIQNIKNEIEFKGCQEITLKNVTGPLVVSTISGGVNVVFTEINKDRPISIAAISGEVDVTLPAKAAVDLEMSTVSGNMYSDFDLSASNKDMRRVGGGNIRAQLNGGGTSLNLRAVSGNIYLRKG
jgi:lia operon protein LiaG